MNSLASNVFNSPGDGIISENEMKLIVKNMGGKTYFIEYSGDEYLPYNIPLTMGEWIVSHNRTLEFLNYIGGQGLINKIGNMGWFLVLLLEIVPNEFDIEKRNQYIELFAKEGLEFIEVVSDLAEDNYPNTMLWNCYVGMAHCTLDIMNNDFGIILGNLEKLTPIMQASIYSYIVLSYNMKDSFESEIFADILDIVNNGRYKSLYLSVSNEGNMEKLIEDLGIDFGILANGNQKSVLLAKWFKQDYGNVNTVKKLENIENIDYNELSTYSDVEILKAFDISKIYLGRLDLVNIVYQNIRIIKGNFHYIVIKGDKYILDIHDGDKLGEKLKVIESILDPKPDSTEYDRLRNAHIHYNYSHPLKTDVIYLYICFLLQKGQYSGAYGSGKTTTMSYLYRSVVGNYLNYLKDSKYYRVPIGVIKNGFLMQGYTSIDEIILDTIEFSDVFNTCVLYGISPVLLHKEATDIWIADEFQHKYGKLLPYEGLIEYDAIEYTHISNYIEYLNRLSILLYFTNKIGVREYITHAFKMKEYVPKEGDIDENNDEDTEDDYFGEREEY